MLMVAPATAEVAMDGAKPETKARGPAKHMTFAHVSQPSCR